MHPLALHARSYCLGLVALALCGCRSGWDLSPKAERAAMTSARDRARLLDLAHAHIAVYPQYDRGPRPEGLMPVVLSSDEQSALLALLDDVGTYRAGSIGCVCAGGAPEVEVRFDDRVLTGQFCPTCSYLAIRDGSPDWIRLDLSPTGRDAMTELIYVRVLHAPTPPTY